MEYLIYNMVPITVVSFCIIGKLKLEIFLTNLNVER